MKNFILFSLLCVGIGMVFGCSSAPLARYPNFPERKQNISSIILLDDVVVLEALRGDTSKIDLPENKKIAKTCLNYLSGNLSAKGYNVDRVLMTSIGMLEPKWHLNRLITVPDERSGNPELLTLGTPPYYLHPMFIGDTLKERLLYSVYSSLAGYSKRKGEPNPVVPAASLLGKVVGGGLMGILLVTGYDIPVSFREGKAENAVALSADKISAVAMTQFTMFFYLIDSETGEIVWDQTVERKGGTISENKLNEMLDTILGELP
jgi:hypothetical protein